MLGFTTKHLIAMLTLWILHRFAQRPFNKHDKAACNRQKNTATIKKADNAPVRPFKCADKAPGTSAIIPEKIIRKSRYPHRGCNLLPQPHQEQGAAVEFAVVRRKNKPGSSPQFRQLQEQQQYHSLNSSQQHRQITGILVNLFAACLAILFQGFQGGHNSRHQP